MECTVILIYVALFVCHKLYRAENKQFKFNYILNILNLILITKRAVQNGIEKIIEKRIRFLVPKN